MTDQAKHIYITVSISFDKNNFLQWLPRGSVKQN